VVPRHRRRRAPTHDGCERQPVLFLCDSEIEPQSLVAYPTALDALAAGVCLREALTRSFNSLPTLKNGNRLGLTATGAPVLGLRPSYDLYSRISNEPNPRISMRLPLRSDTSMQSKIELMISSARPLGRRSWLVNVSISSDLVMHPPPRSDASYGHSRASTRAKS